MAHINGAKASTSETSTKGEFKRLDSGYRSLVEKNGKYPPAGAFSNCNGAEFKY